MGGAVTTPASGWLYICIAVVLVGIGFWRWKVLNEHVLSEEQCQRLSDLVVEDLFELAPEADRPIRIDATYWRQSDLSNSDWIYLCRWMNTRGLASTPNDWGWAHIFLGLPPSALSLTKKSWELLMSAKRQPDISIGDGNGPINIYGQQIVVTGQSLKGNELLALVAALRCDASELPEPDASSARVAADSLQAAADGLLQETSPEVTGALAWIRKRVSEAVGSAGGDALWAGTITVAKALGWFS